MVSSSYAEEINIEDKGLIIEPYFSNIYTFHTYFNIDGNGKAMLSTSLDGHSGDNSKIVAILQRYSDGRWISIKSFSSTSSTSDCSMSKNYYVAKGYSYRVLFNGYIYSGQIQLDYTNQISSLRIY